MKKTWSEGCWGRELLLRVLVLLFLAGSAGVVAGTLPKPTRPALEHQFKQLGFGAIPLQRARENQLCVATRLGGKTRILTVDTGCTLTTLDKSVAKKLKTLRELGIKLDDPNLGLLNDPSLVLIDELTLGSARFPNQPAAVKSLKATFFDGILGCDFYLRHSCWIDCTDQRLYVRTDELKPEAQNVLESSLSRGGYHATPLDLTRALMMTCNAKINNEPVKLLVDTGASFTVLDDQAAIRCHLRWSETYMDIRGIGKIGSTRVWSAKPKSFELDGAAIPLHGFNIGGAEMARWRIGEKGSALESVDGVLGADLLAVSGALIDFRHRKLWFVPASSAGNTNMPASKPR